MSRQYQKYSVEFREQAVRRVLDGPRPVIDVAKEISVNEGTASSNGRCTVPAWLIREGQDGRC